MEFQELVKSRRSCRSFESSPVTEEQLNAVLAAGQWAPSPLNLQPWEFIIITDQDVKAQVQKTAETAKQEVIDKDGPGWVSKYETGFVSEAPALIIVVLDPSKAGLGDFFGQKSGAMQAASASVQNMMLAATELGLETVWFTFFRPEILKSILGVPDSLDIAGVIPIGKAKSPAKAPPRKEPVVHHQRYGKAR